MISKSEALIAISFATGHRFLAGCWQRVRLSIAAANQNLALSTMIVCVKALDIGLISPMPQFTSSIVSISLILLVWGLRKDLMNSSLPGILAASYGVMRSVVCFAFGIFLSLAYSPFADAQTQEAEATPNRTLSRPTIDDLIDHFQAVENTLLDPALTFELEYSRVESEDVTKTEKSGGLTLTEWHVARKGASDWYSEERFTEGMAANGVKLSMLPNKSITRNGLVFDWLAGQTFVTVHPAKQSMNYLRGWDLLNYLGLDIYRHILSGTWKDIDAYRDTLNAAGLQSDIVTGMDEPHFPACLEEHRDEHVLHSAVESIDGHECFVLEWPGRHKTWIDAEKRFAIRRRLVNYPGSPFYRYDYRATDLIEIAPAIWMPRRYVVDHYAKLHYENPSLHGMIANRSQYNVSEITLKSDVERLFSPKLPVGINVDDFVRDVHYTVVDSAQDPFEAPIKGALKDLKGSNGTWRWTLVATNIGLLIVFVYMASRRANTKGPENS